MKKWEYRNRWALVTGASAGFGEAFARALAERGMHLVLTARREERLREHAGELQAKHGIQTHVIPLDLGEPGVAARLWQEATREREIHLLVNNAGFGAHGAFHDVSREQQVAMVQLNCTALMELAHLALPGMRARGDGGIINVASISSFQPVPFVAVYAATKAFVLSLSEAIWAENRDAGLRVLALCPGRSPTEFQETAGTTPVREVPMLILTPEQIVKSGLRALEKGKSYEVPGLLNYVNSIVTARLLPRPFVAATLRKITRRVI